jgi:hypothetical protein
LVIVPEGIFYTAGAGEHVGITYSCYLLSRIL